MLETIKLLFLINIGLILFSQLTNTMTKINFKVGILENLGEGYYNLFLFNADNKKVYSATLPNHEAIKIVEKHNNIKFKSN